jgi:hypothetical protein
MSADPGDTQRPLKAPDRYMTHLAMQEVDEGGRPVTWGEHVTDEEYKAAPSLGR